MRQSNSEARLASLNSIGATTSSYAYTYDNAGNRLTSTCTGSTSCPANTTRTYNAANQISSAGFSYDAAGNLLGDGTSTYVCDALSRVTSLTTGGQTRTSAYNGNGTLVSQVLAAVTTRYTQDLASPLSQILADGTNTSVYGMDRLSSTTGTRSWYTTDARGSVCAVSTDTAVVSAAATYDPYGQLQSGSPGAFGYTGGLQQGGTVWLRARWYNAASGGFGSRIPFAGMAETPYSVHYYQYGYANPVARTDPSGMYVDPNLTVLVASATSLYSKDGWANCPNRPDDGISDNDTVADLFVEDFTCEDGPANRVFTENSSLTGELMISRAVGHLRDGFYIKGEVNFLKEDHPKWDLEVFLRRSLLTRFLVESKYQSLILQGDLISGIISKMRYKHSEDGQCAQAI